VRDNPTAQYVLIKTVVGQAIGVVDARVRSSGGYNLRNLLDGRTCWAIGRSARDDRRDDRGWAGTRSWRRDRPCQLSSAGCRSDRSIEPCCWPASVPHADSPDVGERTRRRGAPGAASQSDLSLQARASLVRLNHDGPRRWPCAIHPTCCPDFRAQQSTPTIRALRLLDERQADGPMSLPADYSVRWPTHGGVGRSILTRATSES
jgi:hypothetical protein